MSDMLPDLQLTGFGSSGITYYNLVDEYAALTPPVIIDTNRSIQWQVTRIVSPGDSVRLGEWPAGSIPDTSTYGQAIQYLQVVNQEPGTNPMYACSKTDFSINASYI